MTLKNEKIRSDRAYQIWACALNIVWNQFSFNIQFRIFLKTTSKDRHQLPNYLHLTNTAKSSNYVMSLISILNYGKPTTSTFLKTWECLVIRHTGVCCLAPFVDVFIATATRNVFMYLLCVICTYNCFITYSSLLL